MSDEVSPAQIVWERYVAIVQAGGGDVTASDSPRTRARKFLDLHSDAWRLAVGDVEFAYHGWSHGDGDDQQSLEAELLGVGIRHVLYDLPQSTERVCGAMLDRFLDWLESPEDETPFITPLMHSVGLKLYNILPASTESLPGLSLPDGTDASDYDWELLGIGLDPEDELEDLDSKDKYSEDEPNSWADPESEPWPDPESEPWSLSETEAGFVGPDEGWTLSTGPTSRAVDLDDFDDPASWPDEADEIDAPTSRAPEIDEGAGVHPFPAFDSDPVSLISTAGGFFPTGWEAYRSRTQRPANGTWALNHYPVEGKLVLQFMGRNFSAFGEVFQEHISSARIAEKGLNIVIEANTNDGGQFIAIGPRKRLKNIFKQLGFPL